jgi:DNA-binding transcriptional LysR family regulator
MDIQLAQTFLDIVNTGSFVRAAKRLNIGQTTVSARIRLLESQLGRSLFVRNKAGASLTPAGEQFLRYAQALVQVWRRACEQVAVPGRHGLLTVGGELSLWNPLLLNWLVWMKRAAPQIALRTEVSVANELMKQVATGVLDIAVMYQPQQLPGLRTEVILTETLLCVMTTGKRNLDESDYVYVDWGAGFSAHHNLRFPDLTSPGLFVDLGPLGLSYILKCGGSGYFRARTVRPYLKTGRLRLVDGAPPFSHPVHAVYSTSGDSTLLEPALRALREVAGREGDEWPIEMPAAGGAPAALNEQVVQAPLDAKLRSAKRTASRKRENKSRSR